MEVLKATQCKNNKVCTDVIFVRLSNCARPFLTSDWLICEQGQARPSNNLSKIFSLIHLPSSMRKKGRHFVRAYFWNLHICMIMQRRCIWKRRFGRSLYLDSFEGRDWCRASCPQRHHHCRIFISLSLLSASLSFPNSLFKRPSWSFFEL